MRVGPTFRLGPAIAALSAVSVVGLLLMSCQDSGLKSITVNDTRNTRFCEILVAKDTGIEIYNTTGVSNCSADLWNSLDVASIAKQYGAMKIEKNGPHYWMMDSG
jgi:hypothetical protein